MRYERVNIWEDDGARAVVRGVNDGSETVPTVEVGTTVLVNPSARQVLDAVAEECPDLLPDGLDARPSRLERLFAKVMDARR